MEPEAIILDLDCQSQVLKGNANQCATEKAL